MDERQTLEVYFEGLVRPEFQVVNVKWNISFEQYEAHGNDAQEEMEMRFNDCRNFLRCRYGTVICSSVGLHEEGENGRPHWHFHFIVSQPWKSRNSSTISNERTRYYSTQPHDVVMRMKECTMKFAPVEGSLPLWQTLSYPLKEKKRSQNHEQYIGLTAPVVNMLEIVGHEIYLAKKGHHEREEKLAKRKADDLSELLKVCEAGHMGQEFTSFREMTLWLDNTFIQKQKFSGVNCLPDPVNYVKNVKKIGVYIGLIKYSEFF